MVESKSICLRAAAQASCFVAGTLVHTIGGLTPIQHIRVGDMLRAQPATGGALAYKRVIDTRVHQGSAIWLLQYFLAGEGTCRDLVVTGNHLFWIGGDGWTRADYLKRGSNLLLVDGSDACIFNIRKILETDLADVGWTHDDNSEIGPTIDLSGDSVKVSVALEGDTFNAAAFEIDALLTRTAYGLQVEDFHTYYVGDAGVWVHDQESGLE